MKIIIPKKTNKISGLIFFLISHNFTLKMGKNQKKILKKWVKERTLEHFFIQGRGMI